MSRAFTNAVKALIPGTVFVGRAPADFVGAYKVLHPPTDTPMQSNVAFDHTDVMHRFVVCCVSNSVDGAQDLDDEVRAALEGVVLLVPGLKLGPLQYTGLGVEADEDLPAPLWEAKSMWACVSTRA